MSTWAVIKTGGKQYKVEEGKTVAVDKISDKTDKDNITIDEVLLVKSDSGILIGKPLVEKAKVTAKIAGNFRDKKIRVVKFKSKSRYTRTSGHRQSLTNLLIEKIVYKSP